MLCLTSVFLVFMLAIRQAEAKLPMYNVKNFPDPIAQYEECGRSGPSFVCDPDNLLPYNEVNEIDEQLKDIYNETTIPCYPEGPTVSRRKGYMVMVAVMSKMEKYHTANILDSMKARYKEARYFAYNLGQSKKWGQHSFKCDEVVIILYSADDGVLYTSTQSKARRKLTDEILQKILLEVLTIYYPFNQSKQRVADAIKYMVVNYGQNLRNEAA